MNSLRGRCQSIPIVASARMARPPSCADRDSGFAKERSAAVAGLLGRVFVFVDAASPALYFNTFQMSGTVPEGRKSAHPTDSEHAG